ncbi:hypothetical protein GCM10010306_104320 [Streptomyces umbrinus]|nr:hypothetical protein GCM10010306_104320 [Streptomyces umbrinus]
MLPQSMNKDADPEAMKWADELRLNLTTPLTGKPNPFGVLDGDLQGYPNGRRINDDIDPPLLRMLEGEPSGPSAAHLVQTPALSPQPKPATDVFPCVNLPHAAL